MDQVQLRVAEKVSSKVFDAALKARKVFQETVDKRKRDACNGEIEAAENFINQFGGRKEIELGVRAGYLKKSMTSGRVYIQLGGHL